MRKIKTRRTASKSKTSSRKTSTKAAKPKSSRKSSGGSGYDRGASGFAKGRRKQQRQQEEYERKKNTPWDFRLKPGEEAEVIILDSEEPFFVSLHSIKNRQGRWEQAVGIADTGVIDPIEQATGKQASYTCVLTVLDKRPYKTREGKTIKVSKKLLLVKGRNLAKFERQFKRYDGDLRGLRVNCARSGDKEAAIGEDLEFRGKIKESSLKKYGDLAKPADYEDIFPIPTAKELVERYNLDYKVSGREEFDDDDDDDADLDKVKW